MTRWTDVQSKRTADVQFKAINRTVFGCFFPLFASSRGAYKGANLLHARGVARMSDRCSDRVGVILNKMCMCKSTEPYPTNGHHSHTSYSITRDSFSVFLLLSIMFVLAQPRVFSFKPIKSFNAFGRTHPRAVLVCVWQDAGAFLECALPS